MIELKFELKPLAKQSFKTTKTCHSYQPKDIVDFKNAVRWLAKKQLPDIQQSASAFHVELIFVFRRPESTKKALKQQADELNYLLVKSTKPDLDNLEKAIYDALSGIVYVNDAQVCQHMTTKAWGKRDFVIIRATELTNPVLMKLEY